MTTTAGIFDTICFCSHEMHGRHSSETVLVACLTVRRQQGKRKHTNGSYVCANMQVTERGLPYSFLCRRMFLQQPTKNAVRPGNPRREKHESGLLVCPLATLLSSSTVHVCMYVVMRSARIQSLKYSPDQLICSENNSWSDPFAKDTNTPMKKTTV